MDLTNEIYNANIQALKKSYPNIKEEDLTSSGKNIVEDCKNGQKTIRVNIDGKFKYAHSKYDPVKEAVKWSESIEIKRNSKLMVYGIGLAYHIEELERKLGKDDENRIYVIEPDYEIFAELIKCRDITHLLNNEKIRFFFQCTGNVVDYLFYDMISWHEFDHIARADWPIYQEMYPEKYLVYVKTFRHGYSKIGIDRNTFLYFADRWHELGFSNLKYLVNSTNYMGFYEAFKGIPCVLVSAGPSLNKNVHLLKEIKGKFPILCVYTAYKVLKNAGIEPDFIISVDSGQTKLDSEEVRKEPIDAPLFCESISDEKLLDRHTGRKIFMGGSCSPFVQQLYEDFKKPLRPLTAGGSVACLGLDLLVMTGANPIILIGQDLAFTGNKTHASGTFYDGMSELNPETKYMTTEGIDGEDVAINEVFMSFKIWFDYYITERNGGREFVDATEGGAKIKGTKIMTLREAIDTYIDKAIDVENKTQEIYSNNPLFIDDEGTLFLEKLKELEESIENIEKLLTKSVNICRKLIKIYEKNEQKEKPETISKYVKQLDNNDKKMKKHIDSFSIIAVIFDKVKNMMANYDNDNKLNKDVYILNKNFILYKGLLDSIKYAAPIFSKSIGEYEEALNK